MNLFETPVDFYHDSIPSIYRDDFLFRFYRHYFITNTLELLHRSKGLRTLISIETFVLQKGDDTSDVYSF